MYVDYKEFTSAQPSDAACTWCVQCVSVSAVGLSLELIAEHGGEEASTTHDSIEPTKAHRFQIALHCTSACAVLTASAAPAPYFACNDVTVVIRCRSATAALLPLLACVASTVHALFLFCRASARQHRSFAASQGEHARKLDQHVELGRKSPVVMPTPALNSGQKCPS